jgi:hypothetical protein
LREVVAAGLQENLRPTVASLEVVPPGRGRPSQEGGPPPAPRGGQAGPQGGGPPKPSTPSKRGVFAIQWTASDPNGDDLSFALYVRGVGETGWRLIEKDLKASSYSWNTESTPDGTVVLRLVASDGPDNPEATALATERVCEPFEVDNTPPRVDPLEARAEGSGAFRVEGRAADGTSPLKSGDYALDSGEWKPFFPSDGIFDSREETFAIGLAGIAAGDHVVLVRVTDALENVGVGKVLLRVK